MYAIIQPDNENVKVWRYMDFTKFISLIETQSLHFTRVDKFEDPFEGSLPNRTIDVKNRLLAYSSGEERRIQIREAKSKNKTYRQHFAVNCWHENEYESAAMWNLYLKSNEGIAIQSTYKLLNNCFTEDHKIVCGKVKYINFPEDSISFIDPVEKFFTKRKSFNCENEIRALISNLSFENDDLHLPKALAVGLPISVNLKNLIQNIYVAPNSPIWFLKLVKSTVIRYGYKFKVKKSQMDDIPLF